MSQYKILDPDTLMECPYDRVHMVAAKRFPYHLIKCRRNYSGRDYSVCPFNAKHEMPRPELRYHVANCADRAMIEPDIAFAENQESGGTLFKGCTDVPAYNHWTAPPSSECWEKETSKYPRVGVDPSFLEKYQFRNTTGLSKAEKKEFNRNLFAHQDNENQELRRPQTTGQAQQLSQQRMPMQNQPPLPNSVFAYSLSTVGIGRGRGRGGVDPLSDSAGVAPPPTGLARGVPPGLASGVLYSRLPEPQAFSSMGIGRGMMAYTDRQSPSFVVPKVTQQARSFYDSAGDSQPSSGDNTDTESSNVSNIRDAKIKKQKRIAKKLKQIESLIQEKSNGKQLTPEEEAKIAKQEELKRELDNLVEEQ